jgi:DNA-binding response OmpR family regulator
MRIIVMEDNFALRDELVNLIESMGHEAIAVSDAREGIRLLETTPADAVITDVFIVRDGTYLPDGGVSLIGSIRYTGGKKLKIDRKAPILAISGGFGRRGGYSPLKAAHDIGADACMRKPLDLEEIAVWIMDTEAELATPD